MPPNNASQARSADGVTTELSGNTIKIKNSSDIAHGDVFFINSSGQVDNLAAGTAGQVLTSQGDSADPTFETNSVAPVGAIIPWHKSFANTPALPAGWVECDGSVLSDAESVYNGQTIPDLNGNQDVVRGNSTSGTTGSLSHTHSLSGSTSSVGASQGNGSSGIHSHSVSGTATATNPSNTIEMVWIMRVK